MMHLQSETEIMEDLYEPKYHWTIKNTQDFLSWMLEVDSNNGKGISKKKIGTRYLLDNSFDTWCCKSKYDCKTISVLWEVTKPYWVSRKDLLEFFECLILSQDTDLSSNAVIASLADCAVDFFSSQDENMKRHPAVIELKASMDDVLHNLGTYIIMNKTKL